MKTVNNARNSLDEPSTEKNYVSGCGNGLSYGLCSMQGWRKSMEDAHCAEVNLPGDWRDWSFFAIFDGHGGKEVSTYCAKHLLGTIMKTGKFERSNADCKIGVDLLQEGIKEAFVKFDRKMRREFFTSGISLRNFRCGSTVISIFVSSTHFYVANLGDSRGVISHGKEIRFTTSDHKPDNEFERRRIESAGGFVSFTCIPRINGKLSVSRSMGDYRFKRVVAKGPTEQVVSPEPDVHVLDRYVNDEFLILACDGIWDVLEPKKLCNYIRYMLHIMDDLEYICKSIIDACFYEGSGDNMSIMIVLLPDAPKKSENIIQQDKIIYSVLEKHIKDIISVFGEMTADEVTKMLYRHNKVLQYPAMEGSPFKESFCFLYTAVKRILDLL